MNDSINPGFKSGINATGAATSGSRATRTASASHGGFDNDVATLNDILRRTVGAANVKRPFTAEDLTY